MAAWRLGRSPRRWRGQPSVRRRAVFEARTRLGPEGPPGQHSEPAPAARPPPAPEWKRQTPARRLGRERPARSYRPQAAQRATGLARPRSARRRSTRSRPTHRRMTTGLGSRRTWPSRGIWVCRSEAEPAPPATRLPSAARRGRLGRGLGGDGRGDFSIGGRRRFGGRACRRATRLCCGSGFSSGRRPGRPGCRGRLGRIGVGCGRAGGDVGGGRIEHRRLALRLRAGARPLGAGGRRAGHLRR